MTVYVFIQEDSDWEVFDTQEEAERAAEMVWNHKKDREKDAAEIFEVCECDDLDDDGNPSDSWVFDEHIVRDFVADWNDAKALPMEVTATKKISPNGTGLAVLITKEARMLGLDRGDLVEITLRRVD